MLDNLIVEFSNAYGSDAINDVLTVIQENNLDSEFGSSVGNLSNLLNFSVRYGLFYVVKFLYVFKNVSYDANAVASHTPILYSGDNSGNLSASISTGSSTEGLKLQIWDKYVEGRLAALHFLGEMRRYSNATRRGREYIYRLNPRYKDHVLQNYP
jgi:hypothetical protein